VLLSELLKESRIKVPLGGATKDDLLRELVDLVAPTADSNAKEAILAAVREREQLLSTGIGSGVAIPHGKTPVVDQLIIAAGVTARPVDFDALDGQPVEVFFLLVGPESASGAHIKVLSRISRLLRREQLRNSLRAAKSSDEFLDVVRASEAI
jgi:mannitol/fructose-specific phosphotransferase system IIA component (Ntr-type)